MLWLVTECHTASHTVKGNSIYNGLFPPAHHLSLDFGRVLDNTSISLKRTAELGPASLAAVNPGITFLNEEMGSRTSHLLESVFFYLHCPSWLLWHLSLRYKSLVLVWYTRFSLLKRAWCFFRGIGPDSRGCVNTEVNVNVRLTCPFCILRAVFSVDSVELVKHTRAWAHCSWQRESRWIKQWC